MRGSPSVAVALPRQEPPSGRPPLAVVMRCSARASRKARYVFDTLLQAAGIPVRYVAQAPESGPWLLYAPDKAAESALDRCLAVAHAPPAWQWFEGRVDADSATVVGGLHTVLPQRQSGFDPARDIDFDLIANAFYFLSSWSERVGPAGTTTRRLHANSVCVRLHIPLDIVDRYLQRLVERIQALLLRLQCEPWAPPAWPGGGDYALVLSHDVDFLPLRRRDVALQGVKTVMRHLVRQRDPVDALRAGAGLARALATGRDPYGCVPEIIAREKELGVRASFQVAVVHRHPSDVNYRIEDDAVCNYLRAIPDAGFDLCLHGSYRSTENPQWYLEEAETLTRRLGRPLGSRQHFLSFDYDTLFSVQEQAGIQYDMSLGYPDHPGPRAGFSYPFFPYHLGEDRPYNVLQISLFLMDVSLRGYMRLKGERAWRAIEETLAELRRKRGCVSVVWHPIVFGGARDPGYDRLFWDMVRHVGATGGTATDARTINDHWRRHAKACSADRQPA